MKKLSTLQKSLLNLLTKTIDDPLTVREIQNRMNFSSTSVVMHHVRQLERKGHLRRDSNNPRNYEVITGKPERPIVYLNLYGLAQCGPSGSILGENPVDRIAISSRMLDFSSRDAFMVKAKGDSMEPRIFDGDFVIAKRTQVSTPGALVVCINNEEALIKKFRKKNGQIELVSLNPKYDPLVAADDFRIEGEVRGVLSTKIR